MSAKDTKTKPLSDREMALLRMPSIASQLPVGFENGAEWEHLTGMCNICCEEIPDDLLRGAVTKPRSDLVVVEAMGICRVCMVATPFLYRFHADMRITGICGGKWRTWKPRPSWGDRLRALFSKYLPLKGGNP